MATTEQKIQSPGCGESISIDDVLTRQIEEKIKKGFEATQKIKEQEIAHKSEELKKQTADIAEKNNVRLRPELALKMGLPDAYIANT